MTEFCMAVYFVWGTSNDGNFGWQEFGMAEICHSGNIGYLPLMNRTFIFKLFKENINPVSN